MGLAAVVSRVGSRAMFTGDGVMVFYVDVLDVRQDYGRIRWLVRPFAGAGRRWVDESKVSFFEESE